jgi:GDP-L-fucose synthase
MVAEVGYEGKLEFDKSKPDGTPSKLMDISKNNNLGWKSLINLYIYVKKTINEVKTLF